MRMQDLRIRLPNVPEEYLKDILKVVNAQRAEGAKDGVEKLKSLIDDVLKIPVQELDSHCVVHESCTDGG